MSRTARSEAKITVVIPTRERCDVLCKSLQTVTSQDYDALEIIVSDNCSADRTREVVEAAKDPRVRYLNTGRRLSMSHNWEFALSHVGDGWLTIMGDDDGLLPGALRDVSALIAESGAKAIRSETCYFAWPSLSASAYGRLRIPMRRGYEMRDCRQWLERALLGQAGYPDLPMLYSGGFVDFEVMRRAREITGSFYRSCNPDVYSAVAIASILDQYVYSFAPFAINGASKHSTGTSHFASSKNETTSPATLFASEQNIAFHADLPLGSDGKLPSSLQSFVYESFLQSAALRAPDGRVTPARQLEVILATAEPASAAAIRDWGQIFARHHGLDFESIYRKANSGGLTKKIQRLKSRLVSGLNNYSTDWHPALIRDVYEAGITAAAVLQISPSRLRNLARGLRLGRRKPA